MNTKMIKMALAGVVLLVSGSANAAFIKYIEISSAVNSYLQVAEVVAWGANSNSDLALFTAGASASADNVFGGNCGGLTPNCVINGSGAMAWQNIYHGLNNNGSLLTVTLSVASELEFIEIFGRVGCCSSRDVYNVSLFDENGGMVRSFAALNANNQESSTGQVSVSVPEPSTLAILALGLMGLASRRFKK